MRLLVVIALLTVLSTGRLHAQPEASGALVEVTSLAELPSRVGPSTLFTGTVLIGPLFNPDGARAFGGANVTFFPGARTHWHSHPAGQTLVVTEGVGWVQARGGERREVRTGDVVWTPPGVEHWHGGTTDHAMTHTALHGAVDGKVVTWMEPVTDAEYHGADE